MIPNVNILVIDDQEIIYLMIKKTLNFYGVRKIDYAPNGTVGIEMDEKNNYDLITCDVTMPGIDGIETARELLKRNPEKKIIMVTAMDQQEQVELAIQTGIKHYLLKPFTAGSLVIKVREMLTENYDAEK